MAVDDGPDPADAPKRIAEIAQSLYERKAADGSVVAELVEYAAAELPGVDYANVTVASRRYDVDTPAATHPSAVTLDEIQHRYREGPCLSAWRRTTIDVKDLETETRWPRFRAEALASTPTRSIMGFQLFAGNKTMGSLNVFAERPNAFDERTRNLGMLFATHSALVWDAARREREFREALASRDIIGQAKGMIMERYTINAEQAFELLRRLSHDTGTAVAQVAVQIVESAQSGPG